MNRNKIAVLLAVAAAAALLLFVTLRGSGTSEPAPDPAPESAKKLVKKLQPRRAEAAGQSAPTTTQLSIDADPVGSLVLEGQVVDGDDNPVPGATVYLSARPQRTTTSGDDGSFSFDALVGRRYAVSARTGDQVGGPVVYDLTRSSDPVIIRVSTGAALSLTVVAADDGAPIAGATVSLVGMDDLSETTAADGTATVRGIAAGWAMVKTSAAGYGTARTPIRVPEGLRAPLSQRVELTRGTGVSGLVVDTDGAPVVGARVVARSAAEPFAPIDVFADGVRTDDKGAFRIDGLSFGSYRFLAFHERYAPGSSDHVSISQQSQPTVEIALEEGAVVAGKVVDGDGQPAAWAEVNLTTDPDSRGAWGGSVARQVVAGEDGRFRATGLPRSRLSIFASTAEASSEPMPVDLHEQRLREDLTLTLTIDGVISGVVVDEEGEPVAEVQVMAQLDFWGGQAGGASRGRGSSFATTDGGGRFSVRGLPDGAYLVRASRTELSANRFLGKGVKAEVGDTDVRIELARDGGVKGRIVTQDGEPPDIATVSIAWAGGAPAVDGEFSVRGIPPGTYDVTVRGASFPSKVIKDVEIRPGATSDMGTIKVQRGRTVSGVVADSRGRRVEGATVVLGAQLIGDGANLLTSLDDATEMALGVRRAVSGAGGAFTIAGLGEDELVIAAEHPEGGRSLPSTVAKASGDATVDLVLVPLGSVRGKVTVNGEPAPDVSVLVASTTGARQILASRSGLDGGFLFDRVAEGSYKVTAMFGGGASAQMSATEVTVKGGVESNVELGITNGNITLSVVVAGKDDGRIDAAQVFMFGNPEVQGRNGGEINQLFLSASKSGDAKMAFSMAGAPAVFEKVKPADYSLCVLPITGDMNDPSFAQRVQQNAMTLAVYCQRMTVAGSPEQQTHRVETPGMNPLPD